MSAVLLNPTPQCSELELVLSGDTRERNTIFEKRSDDLKLSQCFSPLRIGELGEGVCCCTLLHPLGEGTNCLF